jgi:hypothetical protein
MPNPVAYNYTNATGKNLLKPGYTTVCIGMTGPNQPNYSAAYSGLTWRNGIDTSSGTTWVLYSNDYSQGVQGTQSLGLPVGWTTNDDDTDLLTLINSIPERSQQTPFSVLSDAVDWLIADGNYLILNREYPPLEFVDYSMLSAYDPASTMCYPRTGTSAWDIKGKLAGASVFTGTVTVEQISTPFSFGFEEGNIELPAGLQGNITAANSTEFSLSVWLNFTNFPNPANFATIFQIIGSSTISPNNWFKLYIDNNGQLYAEGEVNEADTFTTTVLYTFTTTSQWYHVVLNVFYEGGKLKITPYVDNGVQTTWESAGTHTPANFVSTGAQAKTNIGSRAGGSEFFDGSMGPLQIYTGKLGGSEVSYLQSVLQAAYGY